MPLDPPPFPRAGEVCALASAGAWAVASVLFARALRDRSAADALGFKNGVATLVLAAVALLLGPELGGGLPPLASLGWLAASGVASLGFGDLLYFVALYRLGVAPTIILTQLTPALTALGAWPLYGQPIGGLEALGILLVVAGGAWSQLEPTGATPHPRRRSGLFAALACTVAWTAGNLMMEPGLRGTGVVTAGATRLLAAFAALVLFLLVRGRGAELRRVFLRRGSWRALLAPTLIGTVFGMVLYAAGFKWAEAGVAASLSNAVPLFTVPLAAFVLKEPTPPRQWLAAGVVVAGVALLGLGPESLP